VPGFSKSRYSVSLILHKTNERERKEPKVTLNFICIKKVMNKKEEKEITQTKKDDRDAYCLALMG